MCVLLFLCKENYMVFHLNTDRKIDESCALRYQNSRYSLTVKLWFQSDSLRMLCHLFYTNSIMRMRWEQPRPSWPHQLIWWITMVKTMVYSHKFSIWFHMNDWVFHGVSENLEYLNNPQHIMKLGAQQSSTPTKCYVCWFIIHCTRHLLQFPWRKILAIGAMCAQLC